jgi:hypothetical protein
MQLKVPPGNTWRLPFSGRGGAAPWGPGDGDLDHLEPAAAIADELRRQADVFTDLVELQSKLGRDPSERPPPAPSRRQSQQ